MEGFNKEERFSKQPQIKDAIISACVKELGENFDKDLVIKHLNESYQMLNNIFSDSLDINQEEETTEFSQLLEKYKILNTCFNGGMKFSPITKHFDAKLLNNGKMYEKLSYQFRFLKEYGERIRKTLSQKTIHSAIEKMSEPTIMKDQTEFSKDIINIKPYTLLKQGAIFKISKINQKIGKYSQGIESLFMSNSYKFPFKATQKINGHLDKSGKFFYESVENYQPHNIEGKFWESIYSETNQDLDTIRIFVNKFKTKLQDLPEDKQEKNLKFYTAAIIATILIKIAKQSLKTHTDNQLKNGPYQDEENLGNIHDQAHHLYLLIKYHFPTVINNKSFRKSLKYEEIIGSLYKKEALEYYFSEIQKKIIRWLLKDKDNLKTNKKSIVYLKYKDLLSKDIDIFAEQNKQLCQEYFGMIEEFLHDFHFGKHFEVNWKIAEKQ